MITDKYTTIFLFDSIQPTRLLMLKRGPERRFAPNLYTGLGGKIEMGETQQAGALRELREESGLTGIDLVEFGRLIVNNRKMLHQFCGVYNNQQVPDCPEGKLEWVLLKDVFSKDIIPTARIFLAEWQKRGWSPEPFSLLVQREDMDDIFSKVTSQEVREGLVE